LLIMKKLVVVSLLSFFMIAIAHAQDWANLKRYQMENAELARSDYAEESVVFMGNSITDSWSVMRPEFFNGKPYINRGISGQTTPQMLERFQQDVIELKPMAVVILAGINDIAGNTGPITIEKIADNIFAMAELARANNIKVILCSVLPAADFSWSPELEPAPKILELNALIKSYAEAHAMAYVDYPAAMMNEENGLRPELGLDSVHPNAAGYAVMEPLVEEALEALQK
jgi:lysophospholipase L1-like esterase